NVVLQRLRKSPPDLVVMGNHGHSGVARLLLGSVTENVVRKAECPTLIVRGQKIPAGQRRLYRVLCPVNLTGTALECAGTGIRRGRGARGRAKRAAVEGKTHMKISAIFVLHCTLRIEVFLPPLYNAAV